LKHFRIRQLPRSRPTIAGDDQESRFTSVAPLSLHSPGSYSPTPQGRWGLSTTYHLLLTTYHLLPALTIHNTPTQLARTPASPWKPPTTYHLLLTTYHLPPPSPYAVDGEQSASTWRIPNRASPLTTYHLLLTTYHPPVRGSHPQLTTYHLPLTTYHIPVLQNGATILAPGNAASTWGRVVFSNTSLRLGPASMVRYTAEPSSRRCQTFSIAASVAGFQ